MRVDENGQLILPKNIRQIGVLGDTYRIYVEDFVYTYVHQFIHRRKKEDLVLAAVLLGKTIQREDQEYVFISGAQKVDFQFEEVASKSENNQTENTQLSGVNQNSANDPQNVEQKKQGMYMDSGRQQEFWDRVYQRIKEHFDDCEIVGWYFNLDGSNLEINPQLQKFFEGTYKKGSRFLYYEDTVEKQDAFFVQEQHRLQRLSGYAVYYEKNPQMQEFMVAEKERMIPKPLRDSYDKERREDVVQNYRAIMNKLNEKPSKKKIQPVLYVAGVAVLAVAVATGVGQLGNYQNLKVLEQTMQTLSGAVNRKDSTQEIQESSENSEISIEHTPQESEVKNTVVQNTSEGNDAVTISQSDMTKSEDSVSQKEETVEQTSENQESNSELTTKPADQETLSKETAPSDYYIVKKGDSLVSISKKIYNTINKVEDICRVNEIEDMNMIFEGQKLLLPE